MRPWNSNLEWPTLLVLLTTYVVWGLGTSILWQWFPPLALLVTTISIAQYSSLQHEVLHGHPFPSRTLNEALVFAGITVFIPYQRFRDTHLAHHCDSRLTDPYDDPESNFKDPEVWAKTSRPMQRLLRLNNTLLGRILIGPAFSIWHVGRADFAAIRAGDRKISRAWALHFIGLAMVLAWLLTVGSMPLWVYLLAAYFGFGLLKIRTFLEHRAHHDPCARTVVVEDRGPLALLFLNNNFHAVHHRKPNVAWYRLPALYAQNRDHFMEVNDGYVFASYAEVFRKFFFRAKDPVPHPIWPISKADAPAGALK